MKVFLTGGNGFLGGHCLSLLLERGHHVVVAVRSHAKGQGILDHYAGVVPSNRLSYTIITDIAAEGAYDSAIQADPPFEAVVHLASPFHFHASDLKADMLDPAVQGTTGILKAVAEHAPRVSNVVITSSIAAVLNMKNPSAVYTPEMWNPVTWAEALNDPGSAYLGSKTFAEKAAWEFVSNKRLHFNLTTICPPLIFGPVGHRLGSLTSINTSNSIFVDLINGSWKSGAPSTGLYHWVDVRDVAFAHIQALSIPNAAGKRFLVCGGNYSNADIARIARDRFPELRDKLPKVCVSDLPVTPSRVDAALSRDILKVEYRSLEESVVDSIAALLKQ
ncbi:dihydroflavonol-4-reductase [Fusarium sp. MPI-SDFR-AT-0072]|nr:dihydroflavonol-4-reductase [Fusarium sp. MPI-SDFR-AT-0072]KAI7769397.1 hypothetical protein LZL87_012838 [Fusarium oxysporum]